jgi:hypothetical protein
LKKEGTKLFDFLAIECALVCANGEEKKKGCAWSVLVAERKKIARK